MLGFVPQRQPTQKRMLFLLRIGIKYTFDSTYRMDMSKQKTGSGALFTSGVAAILATTCCLGPLLLVMLGFSGAWIGKLRGLEAYSPYFIAVALVAMFFAYRRIFRPAQDCMPGEVCEIPLVRASYKIIFWVVVALILVALGYPFVVPYFY